MTEEFLPDYDRSINFRRKKEKKDANFTAISL